MRLALPPKLPKRLIPALVAATLAVTLTVVILDGPAQRYLTVNPSLTQRFVQVPSATSLDDLCYRLSGVQGVTGVSYREYSPNERTALVTVFFNPRETSVRQLRIFMLHTNILWQKEMNV